MNATDTDIADLEVRLRAALHARAASTPIPVLTDEAVDREFQRLLPPRRSRRLGIAIGGLAAALVVAFVVVALRGDDDHDLRTSDDPPVEPITPGAPRVLLPGIPLTTDGEGRYPLPSPDEVMRVQAFRLPGRLDGPSIWVSTSLPTPNPGFGRSGTAVEVRHGPAFLEHRNGEGGSTALSVALPDGGYIWVTAALVSDADLVGFIDGLEPLGDRRWAATAVPTGLTEVDVRHPADGSTYTASNLDPDHSIEVALYADGFESRLGDRVASTIQPVEVVLLGGRPAALGRYGERDHWVMLEPNPGQTLELRIQGHSRAEVDALLAGARFVDEATWDAAVSSR